MKDRPDRPAPASPVIARLILGARLRRLRQSAGVTLRQAAAAIRGSDSKISRVELGRHSIREIDVVDLLDRYGVTDPADRQPLLALASVASLSPWWQRYAGVLPTWFGAYIGLEEAASSIETYDTHFVPGLLQTDDYAAGLISLGEPDLASASALLKVHSGRVERFAAGGWRLSCVIDEAVLYRPVGANRVHAGQLRHLAATATWPGVTVRIRRFAAGPPVTPAGFTIIRFADADLPDTVYTEQLTSASYLDRPADVLRYARKMEQLLRDSSPADQTAAIIEAALTDSASRGRARSAP
jgi:transcriptional regulator with XRE-family HTH domain